MKNNLFTFATKELSQDAILCWIANNYNEEGLLKTCAEAFLRLILGKSGRENEVIEKVQILRQHNHIDVLIIVNDTLAIIIEDKTNTSEHGNQIERYKESLKKEQISEKNILCVYYKTGNFTYADREVLKDEEIVKLYRQDLLDVLAPYASVSDILSNYYEHLLGLEQKYQKQLEDYAHYRFEKVLIDHTMQLHFFEDVFGSEVYNATHLPKGEAPIQQGTTYGTAYTWHWISEFSKNIPEELRGKCGRYLGFRLDCIGEPFIALKMYCWYDKKDETKKQEQIAEFNRLRQEIDEFLKEDCRGFSYEENKTQTVSYFECEMGRFYFSKQQICDQTRRDSFFKLLQDIKNKFA